MPYRSTPPSSWKASNTVTGWPSAASRKALMRPDGPDPTIAIGGLVALRHGSGRPPYRVTMASGSTAFSRCGRNHSSCPISIGRL